MKIQLFLEIIIIFILLLSPILAKSTENSIVLGGFLWTSIIFQLILAVFFFFRGRNFSKKESFSLKKLFFGFVLLLLLFLNMFLWNYIQNKVGLGFTGTILKNNLNPFFLWLNIILGTFTAAYYEESFYRYYVPNFFLFIISKVKKSKIINIAVELIIVCLFALAHFHLGWIGIIHSFFAGLLLRYYVKVFNCLSVTVFVHTIFNLIQYSLLMAKL
ncbi:MAG: CPBP family intramembrane metalloprotease [Spirochaetaceae bacterium]|nr:CPBP family intramembrane metalloprotease [Spirochaetaceae bacterium]